MNGERYVVATVAHPRSPWFASVGGWATSAAIPVELVKCVSAEELRSRLTSTRRFSAVLLDGGLASVDRDLLAVIDDAHTVSIVVSDSRVSRDWLGLGATATLPPTFERATLLDALATHAALIPRSDRPSFDGPIDDRVLPPGLVVSVTGPGGTGASTVAIALAQGLARDPRFGGSVVLADFCRNAEQSMLHDTVELAPGLQELVDVHRHGTLTTVEVQAMTFAIETADMTCFSDFVEQGIGRHYGALRSAPRWQASPQRTTQSLSMRTPTSRAPKSLGRQTSPIAPWPPG